MSVDSEIYYEQGMKNVCERNGKTFTWDIKRQIMGTTGQVTAKLIVDLLQLPISPTDFVTQVHVCRLSLPLSPTLTACTLLSTG